MDLKPAVKTSKKHNKIAGIVILTLTLLGLAVGVYLQIAHATKVWPYNV